MWGVCGVAGLTKMLDSGIFISEVVHFKPLEQETLQEMVGFLVFMVYYK